jgi:hypothetical protein
MLIAEGFCTNIKKIVLRAIHLGQQTSVPGSIDFFDLHDQKTGFAFLGRLQMHALMSQISQWICVWPH